VKRLPIPAAAASRSVPAGLAEGAAPVADEAATWAAAGWEAEGAGEVGTAFATDAEAAGTVTETLDDGLVVWVLGGGFGDVAVVPLGLGGYALAAETAGEGASWERT
jgi:hypothetical protein